MKNRKWLPLSVLMGLFVITLLILACGPKKADKPPAGPLAVSEFMRMVPVLTHPRCANCHGPMTFRDLGPGSNVTHPGGAIGDASGITACGDCHTKAEDEWRPGPDWPVRSVYELCLFIKDSRPSGETLLEHLQTDPLIKLGFEGMRGQDDLPPLPPPLSQDAFIQATRGWINAMDAMDKYPASLSFGCPISWTGIIKYTYSKVHSSGGVNMSATVTFPVRGLGTWSGVYESTSVTTGANCVYTTTIVARGNGNFEPIKEVQGTDFYAAIGTTPGPGRVPSAYLRIHETGSSSVSLYLPVEGTRTTVESGVECKYPGTSSDALEAQVSGQMQDAGDGPIDITKLDVLSGTKINTDSSGATATFTWKFTHANE